MKKNTEKTYRDGVHTVGRIWTLFGIIMLLMVPVVVCVFYNAWPEMNVVWKGLLGVLPIFWTVGFIEVLTYVPMLGTGGSYLGFMTGNLSNLKVPCVLNSMESAGVKPGTDEGEVISTIATAVSALVTTLIIALGVILLSQIRWIIESPTLQPAFDNILPALFGGLAIVYVTKNAKISAAPLIFMIIVFICVPSLSGSVGIMVPVGVIIALIAARIMYKKGILGKES